VNYEEVSYEGYGPEGVAIIVDGLTDNTNRTVSEVRSIFSKRGGNMGAPGAVAWMFEEKGQITVAADAIGFDDLFEAAVEAGADDVEEAGEAGYVVTTAREDLYMVSGALEATGIALGEAGLVKVPTNTVALDNVNSAGKILRLIEALEDNDDVQEVWSNADISDEIAAQLADL
ncbi:MAG: YebC/PmpR family DNA-binding transcriptional regulator, partial [Myxococcota bacterium]|jgi:YebC/PmpR family DNA-binding regulatory protein|nr:YebC/PmpR family DNA-binding transcriptional regulator [Myxococcota bacterium]